MSDIGQSGSASPATVLVYLDELVGGWLRPALADEWVTLHVELDLRTALRREHRGVMGRIELERIGRSSIAGRFELARDDGEIAVAGLYVVAAWDPETRRTRRVTRAERALLSA